MLWSGMMAGFKRVIWVVLDSVGIGELPDAADYGDVGRNTLAHVAESRPLKLPTLVKLGLADIAPFKHLAPTAPALGAYGKGATHSPGKDTTTGHWEMAGVWIEQAFPVYKNGFPRELIEEFEKHIGRKTIGNKPASGTEVIKELGEEHVRSGKPIVYASGDSVFQIAAHEEVIPITELYRMCEIARRLLDGPHRVGRVIARPFLGTPGNFVRTTRLRSESSLADDRPLARICHNPRLFAGKWCWREYRRTRHAGRYGADPRRKFRRRHSPRHQLPLGVEKSTNERSCTIGMHGGATRGVG